MDVIIHQNLIQHTLNFNAPLPAKPKRKHTKPAWNKQPQVEISCEACQKTFTVRASLVDKRKYCSPECHRTVCGKRLAKTNEKREDLWTVEEIEILKSQFSTILTENLLPVLSRHTLSSIRCKAKNLGLHKTKEYRLAYLKENRVNAIEALKGNIPWNKAEPIHKVCEICGKAFDVEPSRKETARYCSRECVDAWLKTTNGETHWHYRLVDRTCQWCGKTFKCKPAKVACGEGLFCSRNCLGSATTQAQGGRRSSIELAIEKVLTDLGEPFEAQKQIGPWLVDFYLPNRNLVIECDGKYWHGRPEVVARDNRKNHWMDENGYKLLRLEEDGINADPMKAIQQIFDHANASINAL